MEDYTKLVMEHIDIEYNNIIASDYEQSKLMAYSEYVNLQGITKLQLFRE
jgi:hypothetical protein